MNTPMKGNLDILSNQQAFQDAYARAREFFNKIEGVVGIGFGVKETGGQYTDDIAIVVFVRNKKPEEDLAPDQRIPPTFEGYRTDVRIVGRGAGEACDNATKYDKIQGGIQIMGRSSGGFFQGTLGCIVKRRNDRGRENVFLLTNKHVLFSPEFGEGTNVYHPTQNDENLGPVQRGGLYGNYSYPVNDPAAPKYFIDCAIARIDLDSKCCGSTCSKDTTEVEETHIIDLQVNGVNSISDVRSVIDDVSIIYTTTNPRKVFKVGRTTGKTTGKVMLINAPLDADPEPDKESGPRVTALNTIQIEFDVDSTADGNNCKGNPRFTEQGDSGSIIVDEDNRVIGLHTHRGDPVASGLRPSHACHILPILDHLGICIPVTTGTSHGSSRATDGSGVAPASANLGDFELQTGEIGFTSQQVEAAPALLPGFPDPVPLTDEEVLHMRALLDALHETQKGRELHAIFSEVRREIGYLVRNNRHVKVAWHRNKGPAYFAHVLNHLKGYTDYVPQEIDGVAISTLITHMCEALREYGSHTLRQSIEQYGDELMLILSSGHYNSAKDLLAYLKEKETI